MDISSVFGSISRFIDKVCNCYRDGFIMPLKYINPGDAFTLGILGSVEKR